MFFIIINICCNLNYPNVVLLLICYINNKLFKFSVVFNQNFNLKKTDLCIINSNSTYNITFRLITFTGFVIISNLDLKLFFI